MAACSEKARPSPDDLQLLGEVFINKSHTLAIKKKKKLIHGIYWGNIWMYNVIGQGSPQ